MKLTVNGEVHDLAEVRTVQQLLDRLVRGGGRVAVVVNDDVVPASGRAEHVLNDGDRVEILTFAGGG